MICSNLENRGGTLCIGGADTTALIQKYGSPLYVMDEARIRNNCRVYLNALREHLGSSARPLYASKACSFKKIYEIAKEEGLGIDVVSAGEIHTVGIQEFMLGVLLLPFFFGLFFRLPPSLRFHG